MSFEPQIIGDTSDLKTDVVEKLLEVSRNTGKPVTIISGHDKRAGTSAHNHGLATDVMIPGYNSEQIAAELAKAGFTGIGVYHNKDWSPTLTAHGDIRGSDAAKDTPYYKNYGKPTTWNAHDVGGGPGKRKWEYSAREWKWGQGKPSESKPAPARPVANGAKAGGKKFSIILMLAILAILIAVAISTSLPSIDGGGSTSTSTGGGGVGNISGIWVGTADFNIATDANTFDGTLEYFGYETREVTWVITAQSGGFEIEYTYDLISRNLQDGSMYVPDVTPIYPTATLSGSTLTVVADGRVVGTFTVNGNTMTGTWDDEWAIIYTQRVYTDANSLTLTKQ